MDFRSETLHKNKKQKQKQKTNKITPQQIITYSSAYLTRKLCYTHLVISNCCILSNFVSFAFTGALTPTFWLRTLCTFHHFTSPTWVATNGFTLEILNWLLCTESWYQGFQTKLPMWKVGSKKWLTKKMILGSNWLISAFFSSYWFVAKGGTWSLKVLQLLGFVALNHVPSQKIKTFHPFYSDFKLSLGASQDLV